MYSLACMFLRMYNLLCEFLCNFCSSASYCRWPGEMGLMAFCRTQKSRNKLSKVPNNNENILQNIRKVHQLYTRCVAQLAISGPVTVNGHLPDFQLFQ